MSKLIICFCAFVMLVITPSVHADPIVINSGSVSIIAGLSPTYTLSGQNFSVIAGGEILGITPTCSLCFTNNFTSIDSSLFGNLGHGTAIINGVTFNDVNFRGDFAFRAGVVFLPPGTTGFTRTSPFRFVGSISGCEDSSLVCANEVFSTVELVGHGIAIIQFDFVGIQPSGASQFRFNRITYEFQPDIPEPTTILLFGSGLIGMGVRLISRRRSRP